ncbi:hypothetical protein A2230_05210 [candidate division WOR-1 bacterium RIFOXYA2_FULL_36_21]|uniref:Translocation and assembly module TamB C-terminal domain-containing protein n=1 Tax=candidate division WOR-1 bacterium RIFOXYB2_FULL_36_35 TaxID=1802578 RepID=A0A1F4S1L4_UNCSA|nr:MAG: hypothetical protein A2230_05210 [candidate division WOR-1 bacterium RIFOXYA2_FULL_36_21]OGC14324.1 MAG: hypothetical protein A2290_08290 [candidate division WOR-1 bacterium RIFOXYB2_FULL_36_35]OGC19644.1 MAG: hypothetical protein A2282_02795 [candidate division WOR-1 bacterium RIFOXYA12_FULL_36_13]
MFFFSSVVFSLPFVDSLYENIKKETTKGLQQSFNRPVKIRGVSGKIIGEVLLEGVSIGDEIYIDSLKVNFNLLKFIENKGNIVPSIDELTFNNGQISILRDEKGHFRISDILKEGQKDSPPLKAKIVLNNIKAVYEDKAGMPYKQKTIHTSISSIKGEIDLAKTPKIGINLDGVAEGGSRIKFNGFFNSNDQSYDIEVAAHKLPAKNWINYFVPSFNFISGEVNVVFSANKGEAKLTLNGVLDSIPVSVDGCIYKDLDLSISFYDADIKTINKIFNGAVFSEAKGLFSAQVDIKGKYNNPTIYSNLDFQKGIYLGSWIYGVGKISYADKRLKIESSKVKIYEGEVKSSGEVYFTKKGPEFSIRGNISKLNILKITSNAPGVLGDLSGSFLVDGNLKDLKVDLNGNLTNGFLFGQRLDTVKAQLRIRDGAIDFNELKLASNRAEFVGRGTMSSQKDFSFYSRAKGFRLAGVGILGPMNVLVDSFYGDLAFRLNDQFLSNPIKNLTASGSIEISDGNIGIQHISKGSGKISLKNGEVKINNAFLQEGGSSIFISGQTGIGVETDLQVLSENMKLQNLGIVRQFLPSDISTIEGDINFHGQVSGMITEVKKIQDILGLDISIEAALDHAKIDDVHIVSASLEAGVTNGKFFVDSIYFKTSSSEVSGYARNTIKESINNFDAKILAKIDLRDISMFTSKVGVLEGVGTVDFSMLSEKNKENAFLHVDFSKGRLNHIPLDKIKGEARLKDKTISLAKPLIVESGENKIVCSGNFYLGDEGLEKDIDLTVSLEKGSIQEVSKILSEGYRLYKRFFRPTVSSSQEVNHTKFKLPVFEDIFNDRKNGFDKALEKWDKLNAELDKYRASQEPPLFNDVSGKIKGKVAVSGRLADPKIEVSAQIEKGKYKKYEFDNLDFSVEVVEVTDGKVLATNIALKKSGGETTVAGEYYVNSQKMNVTFYARNMPIDILRFVSDKDLEGRFDADAKLIGTIKDPSVALDFKTDKVKLADVEFNGIKGFITYHKEKLTIDNIDIDDGKSISSVSGTLNTAGDIALSATIEGRSLGLANIFNDEFKWIDGKAKGFLTVRSRNGEFSVKGNVSVTDGIWHVKSLGSNIGDSSITIEADKGRIDLVGFSGHWYGENGSITPVFCAGYIDFAKKSLNFNLSDGTFYINASELYKGNILLNKISLSGPFDKLKLGGKVKMSDAVISFPTTFSGGAGDGKQKIPIFLSLNLDIAKNVYLTAGNVNTIDLSNIFLNMEIYGQAIDVLGPVTGPNIYGRIYFKRGSVSIFNREFTLLSLSELEKFYPFGLEATSINYADFSGGFFPNLNLFALVQVEDKVSNNSSSKKIFVVSHLTGVPFSREKSKALDIDLEAFEDEGTSLYKRASYSKDEIRVLLLPDFVKSTIGLEKGSSADIDTKAVVADYLNSRLQTVVFRGVERRLEQALGLESLTLEYNFGKDLRRALGAKDANLAQKQAFGVGFVKEVFDRFYIDVKYSKLLDESSDKSNTEYFNYQITYRLTSILSISYYREPLSVSEPISGYSKMTLKAMFGF